jgi:arylsulfatase A-like enzyme
MEELTHVPLLLRVPGLQKREVSKGPFSLIHLAPTLLDAAELSSPAEFYGQSYLEKLERGGAFNDVAISECVVGCGNPFHPGSRMGPRVLSVRESRYKLVFRFDPAAENLYDLEADPREQKPLAPIAQKPMRRRLLEVAREHLQRSIEQSVSRTCVQAHLRDLQIEWNNAPDKASPVAS